MDVLPTHLASWEEGRLSKHIYLRPNGELLGRDVWITGLRADPGGTDEGLSNCTLGGNVGKPVSRVWTCVA
jgi:hypothetical protein